MPLFFRCDECLFEDEVYPWDACNLERTCEECGVDGCFKCVPDSLCPDCFDELEADEDEE